MSVLGDQVDHAPFGVNGGGPAKSSHLHFTLGGETWIPPMRSKAEQVRLEAGDRVLCQSPGGGGFGDPLTRPTEEVERDLNLGMISVETAVKVYGVTVDEIANWPASKRYTVAR